MVREAIDVPGLFARLGGGLVKLIRDAIKAIPDDTPELARTLTRNNTRAFEDALRTEAAAAGADPSEVRLSNRAVLRAIEQDAHATARQVLRTYDADLRRFVASLPPETNKADLPRLVMQWNLDRSAWKDAQIATTETAKAVGRAQREFVARSKATGTAVFGGSLKCPLCTAIAARNPYDADDPLVGAHPHPHCRDSWTISYSRVERPWLGG